MDGGYLVYAALGVAAVVDTLRASVPLQKVVGKVSPCLAPQEGVALVVPACKVNFVGLDVYKRQGEDSGYNKGSDVFERMRVRARNGCGLVFRHKNSLRIEMIGGG